MKRTSPEPGPATGENLCPDGCHEVRVAANASSAFGGLDPSVRERLVEMLCDVAEVAARAPDAVDFSRRDGALTLRIGRSLALCSIDATHAVTVYHLIEPEALLA